MFLRRLVRQVIRPSLTLEVQNSIRLKSDSASGEGGWGERGTRKEPISAKHPPCYVTLPERLVSSIQLGNAT